MKTFFIWAFGVALFVVTGVFIFLTIYYAVWRTEYGLPAWLSNGTSVIVGFYFGSAAGLLIDKLKNS